jgi:ribosomal protein S18 acetylase RimI-like enzyme
LRVRAIRPDELHVFTQVPSVRDNPERHARLSAHLAQRWASGASRPGWCFVAEEGGAIVGRVGYWTRPRVWPQIRFIDPLLFDLPWAGEYRRIGVRLLRESLGALRRDGATRADLGVDSPTGFAPPAACCVGDLLTGEGWTLTRETLRFDWGAGARPARSAPPGLAVEPHRLTYRSVEEVGEERFVDAVRTALDGTLDRGARREIERAGADRKARGVLDGARALVRGGGWRADAGWWQLGYTPDGALAGLIMPAINASGDGVVWYIGVAPEQRGRRYVDDLLVRLAGVLEQAGAHRIVADTDTQNWPMARAFARTGWRQFAMSATYEVSLA